MKKIFITGTDTDIGKTYVSRGLCLALKNRGLNVGYYKPLQSGAYEKGSALLAPDIETLGLDIPKGYSYLLKGEASPYLASKFCGIKIDLDKIKNDIDDFSRSVDILIIEGAGGLMCPMAEDKTFYDLIKLIDCETIIVTTPELGHINHTLMTIKCAFGLNLKGVIINKMPKNKDLAQENFVEELTHFSDVEILGIIKEDAQISDFYDCITKIGL